MRGLVVLLIAHAAAADTKHTMHYVEGEAIHIADGGGAINRHADVKVEAALGSTGKVVVTDAGERSEHNLYDSWSTDEVSKWTNLWKGTWKLDGDALKFDLTLASRKCAHTKTTTSGKPETLACETVDKQAQVTCSPRQVDRENATGKPTSVPAWDCVAPSGETPTWLLGKGACLQVAGGMHGMVYQKCASP